MNKPSFIPHLLVVDRIADTVKTACGLDWMALGINGRCSPKSRYVHCKNCKRTGIYFKKEKEAGR